MAPDELGRERAGEAGGAGDEHPRGGVAVERLGRALTHGATPRSRPSAASIAVRGRGDLLVGERAVGGAELEPQREALAPLAELLALVEVEDLGRPQQLAAGRENRVADAAAAGVVGGRRRRCPGRRPGSWSRPRRSPRRPRRRRAAAPGRLRSRPRPRGPTRGRRADGPRRSSRRGGAPTRSRRAARPGCRNGSVRRPRRRARRRAGRQAPRARP